VLNTLLLRIPGLAASPPVLYKLIKGKRVALPFFVWPPRRLARAWAINWSSTRDSSDRSIRDRDTFVA